jgi:integrase
MEFKSAIVNPDSQNKLIEASAEKPHVQQAIKIIIKTGMHIGVICHPKKYSFKVENEVAMWRRPKTNKWMQVRVTPFINFIDAFMRKKRKYSRHSYFSWFKHYGNKAGLKNVSPSTLRHTCAWNLALMGKPVPEIAAFIGCSFAIAERHYLLLTGEDVDRIQQWREKVKEFQ